MLWIVGLVLVALAMPSRATQGVDVSQPTSQSAFSCMVNNGYTFAIVRGYRSSGSVDPYVVSTVANAWSAGMAHVDVYMFPCPTCGNCAGQAQAAVQNLQNNNVQFGMLWLDIEGTQYWMDVGSNQQCFSDMADAASNMGVSVGVYTSASQWGPIMGDWSGGSSYPLWYAHYDGSTDFSDFSPFGGWSQPAIKQYQGDASLCGAGVDMNWYP